MSVLLQLTSFDDSAWAVAAVAAPTDVPTGVMESFIIPPVKRHEPRSPIAITRINATTQVLDFETNQAMQCILRVETDGTQPAGATIRLRHDESVDATGDIIVSNDLGM